MKNGLCSNTKYRYTQLNSDLLPIVINIIWLSSNLILKIIDYISILYLNCSKVKFKLVTILKDAKLLRMTSGKKSCYNRKNICYNVNHFTPFNKCFIYMIYLFNISINS